MGKVSPKDKESKAPKQRRRTRASSNNKYLRPGALAQLRYTKSSSTKACTDLGKKRVALSDLKKVDNNDVVMEQEVISLPESQVMMSPERFGFSVASPLSLVKQNSLPRTPKTPHSDACDSESRLEALPMDVLVKILCHLHHDQLRAVFHRESEWLLFSQGNFTSTIPPLIDLARSYCRARLQFQQNTGHLFARERVGPFGFRHKPPKHLGMVLAHLLD